MDWSEKTIAYIAGAMDGDGSFSIVKNNTKASPNYYPILQFTNWRKSVVYLLKDVFGGHIIKSKPSLRKDGSLGHAIYRWKLRSGNNVKPALERLIPFLRIKKDRASFLLDFVNNFKFIRGYRIEKDVLESRESSYIKMIDYNCWSSSSNMVTTKLAKQDSNDAVFWAYVAGMMDTDGSFSIKRQNRNKGTQVINPRYIPCINISSIDTRALNYIRENCSYGKICNPKNKTSSSGFHYQFGIYSRKDCASFITNILPYLVGKKENAQVLLDFCVNAKNTKYCKVGISDEELLFRDNCYKKLVALNKYGVYKPSLMDLKPLPGEAGGDKAEAGDKPGTVNAVSERAPLKNGDAEL